MKVDQSVVSSDNIKMKKESEKSVPATDVHYSHPTSGFHQRNVFNLQINIITLTETTGSVRQCITFTMRD